MTAGDAATRLGVDERGLEMRANQGFLETRKADDGARLYASRDVLRMQGEELIRELRQALGAMSPELATKVDTLALIQFARGQLATNAAVRETVVSLKRETA